MSTHPAQPALDLATLPSFPAPVASDAAEVVRGGITNLRANAAGAGVSTSLAPSQIVAY